MSCPDWRSLLAERDRAELDVDFESSDAWRSAIDHLTGCGVCRVAALELDPALLFLAQPPLEVGDDEVDRIKANVRTLRRAREAERAVGERRRRIGRVAAAAAVVSLLILLPTRTSRQPVSTQPDGPSLAAESTPAPFTPGLAFDDGPAPMIEPLDLPLARIYQLGEDDLSVVMVVDESIDV